MFVDWTYAKAHVWQRHGLTMDQVQEASDDEGAVLLDPDPKSPGPRDRMIYEGRWADDQPQE